MVDQPGLRLRDRRSPYAIVSWPLREQVAGFSQVGDKILVENGILRRAGWIVYGGVVAGLRAAGDGQRLRGVA